MLELRPQSYQQMIVSMIRMFKVPFGLFLQEHLGEQSAAVSALKRMDGNPDNWMEIGEIMDTWNGNGPDIENMSEEELQNIPISRLSAEKQYLRHINVLKTLLSIRSRIEADPGIYDVEGLDVIGECSKYVDQKEDSYYLEDDVLIRIEDNKSTTKED